MLETDKDELDCFEHEIWKVWRGYNIIDKEGGLLQTSLQTDDERKT